MGPNALFIAAQLKHRKIKADPALIDKDASSAEGYMIPLPALAIIHRSTFEAAEPGRGDDKLVELVQKFGNTRFLIYSRKLDTKGAFLNRLEGIRGASGRVQVVQYTKQPNPWLYFANVDVLLDKAEGMMTTP